jgi:hypothetical protein
VTLISNGTLDLTAFFPEIAADGSPVFFHTIEQLTGPDNDIGIDIYQNEAALLTLLSGGNNSQTAEFEGASNDGTRAYFETDGSLVAADNDGGDRDVYRRQGGVITLISG